MTMHYIITEIPNGAFVADAIPDERAAARGFKPRPVVVAARDCRNTSDVFAAIAQDVLDTDFGYPCKVVIEFTNH